MRLADDVAFTPLGALPDKGALFSPNLTDLQRAVESSLALAVKSEAEVFDLLLDEGAIF